MAKQFLAAGIFPFAIDEGGNYLVVANDRSIQYHVHDTWSDNLSVAENQAQAATPVAADFQAFIESLVTAEEAEALDFGEA